MIGISTIQTFVQTPKETGNKLLNKINWKICQIKMQQIFYIRKLQN